MAAINGNFCTLYIDVDATGSAASQSMSDYTGIQGVTSAGISISNATYETNNKLVTPVDAGTSTAASITTVRNYAVGTTTTSLSIEGVADPALSTNYETIQTYAENKGKVGIFFVTDVTGGKAVGGLGYCTSFELSAGIDDFVTFSASFELDGDPAIVAAP